MKAGFDPRTPCAVTEHFVHELAETNPRLFKNRDGSVNVPRCLTYLGFDVRMDIKVERQDREGFHNKFNYSIRRDMLIRSNQFTTKAYRTTVYAGWLRNDYNTEEVKDRHGNVPKLHPRRLHPMVDLYTKHGTLQATDITKFIPEEELVCLDSTKWEKN